MLSSLPLLKLSTTPTVAPRSTNASTRCDPMNDAPPVTSVLSPCHCIARLLMADGTGNHGAPLLAAHRSRRRILPAATQPIDDHNWTRPVHFPDPPPRAPVYLQGQREVVDIQTRAECLDGLSELAGVRPPRHGAIRGRRILENNKLNPPGLGQPPRRPPNNNPPPRGAHPRGK